jgi:glycosyl transferase family 25
MKILVINLPKSKKRLEFQKKQMEKLGLDYEIIKAVCALDFRPKSHSFEIHRWQRPLRDVEIACYASHRLTWDKIIRMNKPALIIEDDALLSSEVPRLLQEFESYDDHADLINLEVRSRKKFVSIHGKKINNHSKIYNLYQDRTGAAGYVLWPSGAEKLLQCEYNKGIALADAHITACPTLVSYQVEPAAIVQLDQCSLYKINIESGNLEVLSRSNISSQYVPKGSVKFKLRRIMAQIQIGLRVLTVILKTRRRYIKVNSSDFI